MSLLPDLKMLYIMPQCNLFPVFRTGQLVAAAQFPAPAAAVLYLQKIPAGFPSPATDHEEATLDLNKYLVLNPASTFFFKVSGRSMIGAQIDDGDIIAVDRSLDAKSGDIVLAVVNNDFTVKTLFCRGDIVELRPENPDFKPIRLKGLDELTIWGVVTGAVKRVGYGHR